RVEDHSPDVLDDDPGARSVHDLLVSGDRGRPRQQVIRFREVTVLMQGEAGNRVGVVRVMLPVNDDADWIALRVEVGRRLGVEEVRELVLEAVALDEVAEGEGNGLPDGR